MAFPTGYTKYQVVTVLGSKSTAETAFPGLLTEANFKRSIDSLTGTVTITNGSANVSGSSTLFTSELSVGDFIKLDADAALVEIDSITDNTNLILVASYTGTGGTGAGSGKKPDIFDLSIDGTDIRISLDDGTTELPRERVSFDPATPKMEFHFKVETTGSDLDIRVWYNGDEGVDYAVDDTYGAENVWNSNRKMVQHMDDATTSTVVDSTLNNSDGTKVEANGPAEAVGKIGKAQDFDGSNDRIVTGSVSHGIGTGAFTLQAWVYLDSYQLGTDEGPAIISINSFDPVFFVDKTSHKLKFYFQSFHEFDTALSLSTWYLVHLARSSAGVMSAYINGAVESTSHTGFQLRNIEDGTFNIGVKTPTGGDEIEGKLDECIVSDTEFSANWISTEYNNQSSPSTFYTVGDEQTSGATAELTGTAITGGVTESEIVLGGDEIISTLTGETYVATVGGDNEITDAIIAGITSAQSEANGWNNVVKANMVYTDITRTSDTVLTIILAAEATYSITANEAITMTIPATALTAATEVVATPNIIVANESAGGMVKRLVDDGLLQGLTVGRLAA